MLAGTSHIAINQTSEDGLNDNGKRGGEETRNFNRSAKLRRYSRANINQQPPTE
jgi:hypothetical protein